MYAGVQKRWKEGGAGSSKHDLAHRQQGESFAERCFKSGRRQLSGAKVEEEDREWKG